MRSNSLAQVRPARPSVATPPAEAAHVAGGARRTRPRTTSRPPAGAQALAARYQAFSKLAGPLQAAPADYRVRYVSLLRRGGQSVRAVLLTTATFAVELGFLLWLLQPGHMPDTSGGLDLVLTRAMIGSIGVIEAMRLVNVATLCLSTLNACDPVPVAPERGRRVAFVTTMVPGKEPMAMVRRTLLAARQMRVTGPLDVWLLDEGNDPAVRAMCAEVGAHHFSRRDVPGWNRPTGPHRAKTKHGNYNAWLDQHGDGYDYLVSVDPDHVPLVNFCERMLGYFRDPDVAFVVGPQVYGNYDNFVTRAAESQQYLFHSVLQRAANRFGCAMLVGTNNAMRISSLKAIGGLRDSITEDAATSFAWHGKRNSATGNRWKSVYTPDVLAVGEGPSSWTDYFSQQYRWARGTNEVLVRDFWRPSGLSLGRRLHYGLLMSYYPSVALAWVLGAVNIGVYLLLGIGGLQVSAHVWVMLYVDAALLQLGMYFWNRRHNVSPHEEEGASGITGMFISVLSAPIYVTALLHSLLRRQSSFAVTPKSDAASPDGVPTFRRNLAWAALFAALLAGSVLWHHDLLIMRMWAALAATISILPLLVWRLTARARRTALAVRPVIALPPTSPALSSAPAPLVTRLDERAAIDDLAAAGSSRARLSA